MKTENSACAACKFFHRGCPPNCLLRPYFPPDQPKQFENVHRLFGVSKITKILQKIDDPKKRDATASAIKFESNMRAKFPVHGCCQVLSDLKEQIRDYETQLAEVKSAIVAAASQFPTPPLDHNYFPGANDIFSGEGYYGNSSYGTTTHAQSQLLPPPIENANEDYDNVAAFSALQRTLDSLSSEWHSGSTSTSTYAQQQLPSSNNNHDNALAAQRALLLGVPYPNNDGQIQFDQTKDIGDESATKDFFPAGGHGGNFAYGDRENGISHGQQLVPNYNNLPYVTQNFNEEEDLYSFAYGGVPYSTNHGQIQTIETGKESVTNDFFPAGGHYGDLENEATISHGQEVVPNSNNLPPVTDYDDAYFFAYGVPCQTNDDQSAKYIPKDDGNPFL